MILQFFPESCIIAIKAGRVSGVVAHHGQGQHNSVGAARKITDNQPMELTEGTIDGGRARAVTTFIGADFAGALIAIG